MNNKSQDAQEVVQVVDKWAEAQRRGDSVAAAALLADQFVYTGRSGQSISRDEWLGYVPKAKLAKFDRSEPNVIVAGDAAVLSGIIDYDSQIGDMRIADKCRYAVTLAKTGGSWKALYAHFTPIT